MWPSILSASESPIGWTVSEPEEHDQQFEESLVGPEGCLSLLSLRDVHIVVSPPDISSLVKYLVSQSWFMSSKMRGIGIGSSQSLGL